MKYAVVKRFMEMRQRKNPARIYELSLVEKENHVFFLIRENLERKLVILGPTLKQNLFGGWVADEIGKLESEGESFQYMVCSCSHQNASTLREIFSFTRPRVAGLTPAIGMGDRIGLATPGHIRAVKKLGVFPVLAQQSIREMESTLRTPMEVLDDVSWAVFQEGYRLGFGADADHLKTLKDVDATFEAGFTMYTIDPSDYVDNAADNYDPEKLREKFEELPWEELECRKEDYLRTYIGKKMDFTSPKGTQAFELSEEALLRAAVKYSAAIAHTTRIYHHLKKLFGERRFDLEMSVDETETPTSPSEHYFIVSELKRLGVRINGLALRFVGRFEKSIDYIGDLKEFEESFERHVSIARFFCQYKLSIHSGSDKFSVYPVVGRSASDIIHLKTAGTSYLEALRVVARHDPGLFREIVKYTFGCFEKDRKKYHVSTNLSLVPSPDGVSDVNLETVFLGENNGRQLLHITYGSVLTAKKNSGEWLFRERMKRILIKNEEEHYETVAKHIRCHIESVWFFAEKSYS